MTVEGGPGSLFFSKHELQHNLQFPQTDLQQNSIKVYIRGPCILKADFGTELSEIHFVKLNHVDGPNF